MSIYEKYTSHIVKYFNKMQKSKMYCGACMICGFFTMLIMYVYRRVRGIEGEDKLKRRQIEEDIEGSGMRECVYHEVLSQVQRKNEFFGLNQSDSEIRKAAEVIAAKRIASITKNKLAQNITAVKYGTSLGDTFEALLKYKSFFAISLLVSFPMYVLISIYSFPYIKYIFERLLMLVFVLIGVTVVVFTIIYISPTDPAASALGMEATKEQVESFRESYGLNDSYVVQLGNTLKKLVTFDLGKSYVGNESIADAIGRRFPVTLLLGLMSMTIALGIAMPAGIVSAINQYSGYDYVLMLIALLGLSIPNFWLGLILILKFSIELKWLPATYQMGNWLTLIMPAIVFGTGMSANFARMTRSSMLEVCRADYVVTARAKGLSERKVIFRHILKNALIPIITVVGIQLASTLGGAATTEKVFNINGIGTYTAEKSLLPDTPAVIASVIYISVIISVATLAIDIMYTFIDPRIKTRLKNY